MNDFHHKFKHIYGIPPIDFWEGAVYPNDSELYSVLEQMPEEPRSETVYKLYIPVPDNCQLVPIFLCKAENNGTVYIFSDTDLKGIEDLNVWEVKNKEE